MRRYQTYVPGIEVKLQSFFLAAGTFVEWARQLGTTPRMATSIRYRDSIFGLDPGQQNLLWCNTFFLCNFRQRFIEGATRHLCDWTGNQRKNQYYLWSLSFYSWQPTGVHHKPLWQFHGPYRNRWLEPDRGRRMDWALSVEEGEVNTILVNIRW